MSSPAGHVRRWKPVAGRAAGPFARAVTHSRCRVLMYHRFGPASRRHLDAGTFSRHLEHLARHFDVRRLEDCSDAGAAKGSGTRPTVALTVDDGYADFMEYAYPLLLRFGIPATVFVVSRFAAGEIWLWFDAVRYLLETTSASAVQVTCAGELLALDLASAGARERAWSVVGERCLRTDSSARQEFITHLQDALGVPLPARPTAAYRAMSWSDLAALDPGIVTLGSHTRTHPVLSRCSSAEIADEVTNSRVEIEERMGRRVSAFCYPNGQPEDYDTRGIDAVRAAGYRCATVAHGTLGTGGDAFTMQRMAVPFDVAEFERAVDGVTELADQWRAWRSETAS